MQTPSDIPCSCGGGPGNCLGQPAGDDAPHARAGPSAGWLPPATPIPSPGPAATVPAAPAALPIPLSQLRVGQCGIIQEKRLDEDDRSMLRAMGLACNSAVTLCRQGEPCIVAITTGGREGGRLGSMAPGCRIGLTRELSQRIFVTLSTPVPSGTGVTSPAPTSAETTNPRAASESAPRGGGH